MISALIVALIWIAVFVVIGYVVTLLLAKAGVPAIATTLVWCAVALVALLILLDIFGGGSGLRGLTD